MVERVPGASPSDDSTTAAGRYAALESERETYLNRAREASQLTVPSLLPPEGSAGNDLYKPFQSVGARGVNNLAAKLLLALFPPGSSFFRLTVDPITMQELVEMASEQAGIPEAEGRSEIEAALGEIERTVVSRMEQRGVRTTLFEALKHLIVAGNVLVQVLDDGRARLHTLDRYVVKRDRAGNVLEIITKETIAREALPQEISDWIALHQEIEEEPSDSDKVSEFDLYTWVRREGKKWNIHQEVSGFVIPDTEGTEPLDRTSFLALRMSKIDGEDYGRALVEEYIGDLLSLEGLSKAIVEFSAAASKILFFVNETGLTDKEEIARAPSGAFLDGSDEDITSFQIDKYADFQVASAVAERIENRLEQAFLLFSSIQRNAERVTAEEIRTVANELEQALGGVYSILAQELQRPLVDRVMFQLQRSQELPKLPSEDIKPQIVAGLEGLSRSSDLQKYRMFAQLLQETIGPEETARRINGTVYAQIIATSLGIEEDGLVKSEEELKQEMEEARQQQMAEKLAPEAAKAAQAQSTEPTE